MLHKSSWANERELRVASVLYQVECSVRQCGKNQGSQEYVHLV